MSECCNPADTFWADQLAAWKLEIIAYNAALRAFAISNIQSYRLMTGQTDQMVTRANITSLKNARDSLLNDIDVLEARLCGTSTIRMVPGFP
jgi:hypothetical protein